MPFKDQLAPDEWARVVGAPMLAGIAMTAADPGGLWGAVKESAAAAGAIGASAASGGLVAEIVAAYETSEGRELARGVLREQVKSRRPAEIVDAALTELGAVAGLVAAKAPDAAPGFKAWLKDIAGKVAEAGTEGGFLGFGGVQVSDAEKATLDRLESALA